MCAEPDTLGVRLEGAGAIFAGVEGIPPAPRGRTPGAPAEVPVTFTR